MANKNKYLCRCGGWSLRTLSLLASIFFVEKKARPMKGLGGEEKTGRNEFLACECVPVYMQNIKNLHLLIKFYFIVF